MTSFEEFEAKSLSEDYGMTEARPIEVIEGEILFYKAQAGGAILEIGHRLIEAKKQLAHGQWLGWLEEKVQFSARTAQRFMKLAKGYRENDTLTHLGARKALVLLELEEAEREEFAAEMHEVNGAEKTVEDMTAEELEEAVRLRKEAEAEAEQLRDDLKVSEAKRSSAEVALNTAEREKKKLEDMAKAEQKKAKELLAAANKHEAEAKRLSGELDALKKKPVEVAVREPSREEMETMAAPMVEAARAEGNAEIARLKKALAAADPYTAAFKVRYEEWQQAFTKMVEALEQVASADPDKAGKLKNAVMAAREGMVL